MRYPGGKNGSGVAQTIISLQPPHDVYVEPFGGSGAVLRAKRPAAVNVACDLDERALAMLASTVAPDGCCPGCTLRHEDGLIYLARTALPETALVYCDPPYLMATRSSQRRYYRYELELADHERLLRILTRARYRVQISGYPSELYESALAGWTVVRYPTVTRGGAVREEWLWMNYPIPERLHDYRYLGRDYVERDRIRRKLARRARLLLAMPVLERRALLEALSEADKR